MKSSYGNQREAVLLSYMAGIFDGEGSVGITKTLPKRYINPRYTARVMIGMAEKNVVELFSNRYGGSVLIERVQNRKVIYRWKKVGDTENTSRVLEELLPYMMVKNAQAIAVLDYIKTKVVSGYQKRDGMPIEELQRREQFYQVLKKLNASGAPATTNRDDTREGEVIV